MDSYVPSYPNLFMKESFTRACLNYYGYLARRALQGNIQCCSLEDRAREFYNELSKLEDQAITEGYSSIASEMATFDLEYASLLESLSIHMKYRDCRCSLDRRICRSINLRSL